MATEATQLDRIEDLLRHLLAVLIRMNERLDMVCGKEMKEQRSFGEVPL